MTVEDVAVEELVASGEGLAFVDVKGERRAVFVPGVVRGERVRIEVDARKRPARGRVVEVLERSPHRSDAACAHVARCGGCDWMHLGADERVAEHARIVEKLLGTPVTRAWPAEHDLGYRTRARLHAEGSRVGMFGRGSHEPVVVDRCVVLDPALDRARAALSALLAGARGRGEVHLALGRGGRPVFDLRWNGDALPPAFFARLEKAVPETFAGARVFSGDVRVPATVGDPVPVLLGADGVPLELPPGGFAQATEAGNAVLARRVHEVADGGPCVELYAGAGNLTVLLARDREVTAVESSAEACAAARANLKARGLAARVVQADAATFAIPKPTRLVVLDPPREGARDVARALAGRKKLRIVYVSCDPPTLARDVAILRAGGHAVEAVETFEMFPQTSHVETVVVLA